MSSIDYRPAGVVAADFHASKAFIRGIMGPVGSSKSSTCWMDLFYKAIQQEAYNGVRSTRWAVLRNTYPELKSTTIKTALEWCPFMEMRWDSPISGRIKFALGDGTTVDAEVYFLALERPEEIDKLGSLELTYGWANEVREIAKPVVDKLTERVGRYPKKNVKTGFMGATWCGVVMDTNPPDVDSWYYKLAEGTDAEMVAQTESAEDKLREMGFLKADEPLMEFFRQPGGLIDMGDNKYDANPAAENVVNLHGGHAYYFRQLAGKKKEWIKAQILGEYATLTDGRPVYEEYNDEVHCRATAALKNIPIIVGLDYGRTPAASFVQVTPRGQLRIIDELISEGMGVGAFAEDVLKPHIAQHYREFSHIFVGDPAGMARESDERSAFDVLASYGIVAAPAHTNRLTGRLEAVKKYLTRMIDGQPALSIDPKADQTRKGFIGKYYYKRLQTNTGLLKETPEKNEYSHIADALQYAALWADLENTNDTAFKKPIKYPDYGYA